MTEAEPSWFRADTDEDRRRAELTLVRDRIATLPEPELAEPSWDPRWGPDPTADPDYQAPTAEELTRLGQAVHDAIRSGRDPSWPEPEDRGTATLSALGDVEYVEDLIRPGRIVTWAAEEGSGKSYAVDGELGIRLAVAGGSFAGTWPVLRSGTVLVLSEMHADDDYVREATVLASLGLERSALAGRYFRLPLMTAAGGAPALTVPDWRAWVTAWLREHEAVLLIVDTATGATQVDPWGQAIQGVYRELRVMLDTQGLRA